MHVICSAGKAVVAPHGRSAEALRQPHLVQRLQHIAQNACQRILSSPLLEGGARKRSSSYMLTIICWAARLFEELQRILQPSSYMSVPFFYGR